MDLKPIQKRMRRTKQAHAFPWVNPSAPLRRSLRELIQLAGQLQVELNEVKKSKKGALSNAKVTLHWKSRVAALTKQLIAGLPTVAKGGAPRTPEALVARIRKAFPLYSQMPASMKKPFIRLQEVTTYLASTQKLLILYQRALADAEKQVKKNTARWDKSWKALRAEAKRQNPKNKRLDKLFA